MATSFFDCTALMALLPLVARAQGGGAISAVFFLPRKLAFHPGPGGPVITQKLVARS